MAQEGAAVTAQPLTALVLGLYSEQLLAVGAALALPFPAACCEQPWTCAVFPLCLAAGASQSGQSVSDQLSKEGVISCPDNSIARAESGHTCPVQGQRHALICRVVNVHGVPPAAPGDGVGCWFWQRSRAEVECGASQMWLQNSCLQLPRFLALLRARTLGFWGRGSPLWVAAGVGRACAVHSQAWLPWIWPLAWLGLGGICKVSSVHTVCSAQ